MILFSCYHCPPQFCDSGCQRPVCFGGEHSFTGLYKGALVFNCHWLKLSLGVHCVCSLHFSRITIILTEKQNCLQTGSLFLGQQLSLLVKEKDGSYKTQVTEVTGHCFTNTETTQNKDLWPVFCTCREEEVIKKYEKNKKTWNTKGAAAVFV